MGAATALHKSQFRGFASAPPPHAFLVLDMSEFGAGEWREWDSADVDFVWTALHTFGGNDGLKGNATLVSRIPFDALPPVAAPAVLGVGYTPEGARAEGGMRGRAHAPSPRLHTPCPPQVSTRTLRVRILGGGRAPAARVLRGGHALAACAAVS